MRTSAQSAQRARQRRRAHAGQGRFKKCRANLSNGFRLSASARALAKKSRDCASRSSLLDNRWPISMNRRSIKKYEMREAARKKSVKLSSRLLDPWKPSILRFAACRTRANRSRIPGKGQMTEYINVTFPICSTSHQRRLDNLLITQLACDYQSRPVRKTAFSRFQDLSDERRDSPGIAPCEVLSIREGPRCGNLARYVWVLVSDNRSARAPRARRHPGQKIAPLR